MSGNAGGNDGVGVVLFIFFFLFFIFSLFFCVLVSVGTVAVGKEWSGWGRVTVMEGEGGSEESWQVGGGMIEGGLEVKVTEDGMGKDGMEEGLEKEGEVPEEGVDKFSESLFSVTGKNFNLLASLPLALPLSSEDKEEETSAAGPWTRLGRWEHFPAQQWRCSRLRCD